MRKRSDTGQRAAPPRVILSEAKDLLRFLRAAPPSVIPSPSPPLSSRAQRGICSRRFESHHPLGTGSAKDLLRFLLAASLAAGALGGGALLGEERPRIRDLGVRPGILPPGKWNAITDVARATGRSWKGSRSARE